jgi:Rv2525c-like, glycoside hydrolase-like domain
VVRRIALVATVCVAVAATLGSAPARTDTTRLAVARATFTGSGFDTCGAPSLEALSTWLASPYRAVGIYIGGANRACPDGNLSASWVASAAAGGWSLFPLYVGLQAPCVSDATLARIDPASASAEGAAAATDAASRAQLFGLGSGVPLYFDMEGYSTTDAACTQAVQQFVSGWVGELHALGYVAGIYGSASSTIRDMVPLAVSGGSPPDQVDIGNWNGNPNVFGDPYVPDAWWAHHQRIHQYRGGHHETYGVVTLNVDDDYLDAAVAAATTPVQKGGPTPAGSATSPDGLVAASWPARAFPQVATVTVTPSTLRQRQNGFAAGSYVAQLSVAPVDGSAPPISFAAPVTLAFLPPAAAGLVPAVSADGQTWTVLLRLPGARLPARATAGYTVGLDGRVTVLTTVPGWFGLLRDVGRPTRPDVPTGMIVDGALRLAWSPSQDNSGTIAGVAGSSTSLAVHSLDPSGRSVFRIVAVDAAGNPSIPSAALLVVRRSRPADAPAAIPAWAWHLLDWQRGHRSGIRPPTPRPLPTWYWHWASWELQPYRITPNG